MQKERILIVGGGFAGVEAAKELCRRVGNSVSVRLVDPKGHLEYHGAMYRMVTGRSPMEVCIPFSDIFGSLSIETVRDSITSFDLESKVATGASGATYHFDTVVVAVGSVPSYFSLPGVERSSFSMQSTCGAARLKNHIEKVLVDRPKNFEHAVVIGGGPTGVELAGELMWYLTERLKGDTSGVHAVVTLLEAFPRILGSMSEKVSVRVQKRLEALGVKVRTGANVESADKDCVIVSGERICAGTTVWTAGVRAHPLLAATHGVQVDPKGRALVDSSLRLLGIPFAYAAGDAASTKRSGMAQTALYHGKVIARAIAANIQKKPAPVLSEPKLVYAVPVGPRWAACTFGSLTFYGHSGWAVRRLLDLVVFLSLLPLKKAWTAFRSLSNTKDAFICATK